MSLRSNVFRYGIYTFAAAIVFLATVSAQAARPVARWDVIPDQRINDIFNVGVVAFHVEGVKVEFAVNGSLVHTAENPTYNERTDVWEFWFPLDPSQYADGPITITAKAICLNDIPANPQYDLPELNLYANSGGTVGSTEVKWVDSVNGSDSNPGTEEAPYQTLAKGVSTTPAGGTVYLKAGSYESQALGGGHGRLYWTTISAAPGLGWDDVEVGPGRPSSERMKWTNLSLYSNSTSGSYTTILFGENGNHSVWVDNCKAYNKNGRYAASTNLFGNRYKSYLTGGLMTELANGPGGGVQRGVTVTNITSDVFSGSSKLVVNCAADDVDPGSTGAHPDFHQSYILAPDFVQDVILYNVKGYECNCQGLFGSRLRNSAFVNVMFKKVDGVSYRSQYSGPVENVLFLHMNFYNQSWMFRGKDTSAYTAVEVKFFNNIVPNISTYEDGTVNGMDIDSNHIISTSSEITGTNFTEGDPLHVDAASYDYSLQEDSPAYGTGRHLQCVPADIDGNLYNPDAPNKGPYSSGIDMSPVRGKYVFYNNSSYDGNNALANASDDNAIATDKSALRQGETASFENYTSYAKGINGIIVDILDPPAPMTAADFTFKVGNDSNPAAWSAAPAPLSVTTRNGAGAEGSDRVTIIFADGAITGQWLQVTVKATAATGLAEDNVFYFGNAPGDTGNSTTDAIVDATDEITARNTPKHFMDPAAIDDPTDHDRDGKVDATDEIISRNNVTTMVDALELISP